MQTKAESSVTRKSEHLNDLSTSPSISVAALGSDFEKEMLLIMERFSSSNQATILK